MATVEGMRQLGRMILAIYPESKHDLGNDLDADLWASILGGVEDRIVHAALKEHVRRGSKYAPNAGEIAALCREVGISLSSSPQERKYIAKVRVWLDERKRLGGQARVQLAEKTERGA